MNHGVNQSNTQLNGYLYTIDTDKYARVIFAACDAFNPKGLYAMLERAELEGKKIILDESGKSDIERKMDIADYCRLEMFLVG